MFVLDNNNNIYKQANMLEIYKSMEKNQNIL